MKDLIERLEKLDGPDRELGRQVLLACGWRKGSVGYFHGPMYRWSSPDGKLSFDEDRLPDPTKSIDAAVSLLPAGGRLRELGQWDDNGQPGGWFASVTQYIQTGEHSWECHEFSFGIPDPMEYHTKVPPLAANGAIALTIAALRARSALSPVKGEA